MNHFSELSLPTNVCGACVDGIKPPFPFTMAFQPVVDLEHQRIYAYEALVRGLNGESAFSVLSQVTTDNRYAFDQSCRMKAIELAGRLGLMKTDASLSINFLPGAMYRPENCVRATLAAAKRHRVPLKRLIFELTENEEITDYEHLESIFRVYRSNSFRTALDDFGSGFSGLALLARFQPDVVKIDMSLIRGLDSHARKHAVVSGIVGICRTLGTKVVAEGVETQAELAALRVIGVNLFQGYLFAKPGFEALPKVDL
ncbi:EAL domain-containing protein [Lichenicoccus roseus]|nr:EAL domain-containing protein [Lichenicoccus roseus]